MMMFILIGLHIIKGSKSEKLLGINIDMWGKYIYMMIIVKSCKYTSNKNRYFMA